MAPPLTCFLTISSRPAPGYAETLANPGSNWLLQAVRPERFCTMSARSWRSEERRVGKEGDARGRQRGEEGKGGGRRGGRSVEETSGGGGVGAWAAGRQR